MAEKQCSDARPGDVNAGGIADVGCRYRYAATRLCERVADRAGNRDFEAVEDPNGAQPSRPGTLVFIMSPSARQPPLVEAVVVATLVVIRRPVLSRFFGR